MVTPEYQTFASAAAIAASLPRTEPSITSSPTATLIAADQLLVDGHVRLHLALEPRFELVHERRELRVVERERARDLGVDDALALVLERLERRRAPRAARATRPFSISTRSRFCASAGRSPAAPAITP